MYAYKYMYTTKKQKREIYPNICQKINRRSLQTYVYNKEIYSNICIPKKEYAKEIYTHVCIQIIRTYAQIHAYK